MVLSRRAAEIERCTEAPLILKRPIQPHNPRVSIESLERIPFYKHILGLLLALDMILV